MADAPDDPQFIASMASAAKLLTQDGERQMQCLLHQASDEARTRVATAALAALLAEPWSYDFTRLLLCADAEAIGEVSKVGAGELPDSLTRWPSICSVAQARAVYEPALQRRVKQLLIAGADANGARGEGPPQLPLMCCAMNGWTELAKCLLTAQADVTLCDACGSTALHYAAIHHEDEMCGLLLKAAADPGQRDAKGRSPRDIAQLGGGAASNLLGYVPEASTSIVVLDSSSLTAQRFIDEFVALKRPVLLKQAARDAEGSCRDSSCCRLGFRWQKDELLRHAGDARSLVSDIPYGSDFGLDSSLEEPMTLRDFLTRHPRKRRRCDALGKRPYFFVAVDHETQPELALLLEATLGLRLGAAPPFPRFEQPLDLLSATTLQFAIGDEGSGSPLHFHQDAVNLLLCGRKRWWLLPPSGSAMSRLHPLDVLTHEADCFNHARVLEQEVGDVVYVPDMWGHAVLNLEANTLCIAAEFA
ncbi:unnamed protein product [Effrenium voratum]|nr:unnamed protein product [Effrenium voratum]